MIKTIFMQEKRITSRVKYETCCRLVSCVPELSGTLVECNAQDDSLGHSTTRTAACSLQQ